MVLQRDGHNIQVLYDWNKFGNNQEFKHVCSRMSSQSDNLLSPMSQGPVNLQRLQTKPQMTHWASENSILIGFTCTKICGSWGEHGCRDLFCVTTLEKTDKKAWLVQSPIPNPGLRSRCKWRTFQVLVTVMAPVSPAWCSEELLPLCEISLQEKSLPYWLTPGLSLSLLQALVGSRGSQFLGGTTVSTVW